MSMYYPSQAGYPVSQPIMPSYGMPGSYAPTGGMIQPTVVSALPTAVAAPMVMQPGYGAAYGGAYGYNPYSWGSRMRRFLGLAPSSNVRYKRDRSTWGFMGYSRRQRYTDGFGREVDRKGNPVYRI